MGFMCDKPHVKLDHLLLASLLLCYGVGNAYCSTVHEISGDLHSLLDFKQGITSDPTRALSSWNTSTHYCRWRGVICTLKRPWRVLGLILTGRSIAESNLIGRGSYGSVYRGKLEEQKLEVAVKVFNLEMQGAERSFMLECEALRSIQHRNLLPIITACSTEDNNRDDFKALVYEFMANGNLDMWLHHKGEVTAKKRLCLIQRISIALDITNALDYLYFDCGRPIVHCDLKPTNILLDDDMTALLGDFGIARFYVNSWAASTSSISLIGVKGTIGYIAPGGGHASTLGDVYSFGIVLLEMLVGKRPTDAVFKDGLDIVSFVESNFLHQIFRVLDPYLIEELEDFAHGKIVPGNAVNQCVVSLLQVALSCTRPLPSERMNMKQIATQMQAIKARFVLV